MITLTDGRRLIDADDLIEVLLETRREEIETTPKLVRFIEKQPTIEPKPKRGRWKNIHADGWSGGGLTICSCCGYGYSWGCYHEVEEFNFCPNCGAKMEQDE